METNKLNGSLQQALGNTDQEEVSGKIKVLVHQDAFDNPECILKKDSSSGGRPHILLDTSRRISQGIEPDDVITPLSEESSPTLPEKQWEDKPSSEQYNTDAENSFSKLFPCCGDLMIPSSVTFGRMLGLLLSFAFYAGNLFSDIAVCYHLFFHGNMIWFALVAAFTIIPTIILNSISYHLSVNKMIVKRSVWNQSEAIVVSIIVALLHLTQFGVFARYFAYLFLHELEYLWLIFCPNEKRKDYDHHSGRYVELSYLPYLFMVEAMVQCLPQLLVQLYILIEGKDVLSDDINQMLIISIAVSFLNLTRLLTQCKHVQKNFTTSWSGLSLLFFCYFFTNVSRVLSFALFMTKFLLGFLMLCFFHWIIMSIWAVSVLTTSIACLTWAGFRKNCAKYLKGFLFGIVYLLCFIELKIVDDSQPSRVPLRYLYFFFYTVILLENAVLVILWFIYSGYVWFSIPAILIVFFTYFIGVFFMYLYYRYFHRNVVNHSDRWKCILYPARNNIL